MHEGGAIQSEKSIRSFDCTYFLFKLWSRYMCFVSKLFITVRRIHDNLKIRNRPNNKKEGRKKGTGGKGRARGREGKGRGKKEGKKF